MRNSKEECMGGKKREKWFNYTIISEVKVKCGRMMGMYLSWWGLAYLVRSPRLDSQHSIKVVRVIYGCNPDVQPRKVEVGGHPSLHSRFKFTISYKK